MPAPLHVLTRKRFVLPVALVVAAVAAFEGYAAYTRSKPVEYARGGSQFAPTVEPTSATTAPSSGPSATASPVPSSTAKAAAPAGPRSRAAPAAVRGTQAPAVVAGVVVPRAGTYQLAVSGSEKVDFGPVSFCSQALPRSTTLVVSKASGESPTSYDFDVRYFPSEAGKHDERHLYRYTAGEVLLDYEIATVTCQGVRQSSDTDYAPPQLRAKLPLKAGASWTSKGGDADRTETSSSTVTRAETLLVHGEQVPTYVIETSTTFTGSESGSRTQTWWYAPSWAMPVKWSEHIDGGRSGASYREDVTVTVTSRP